MATTVSPNGTTISTPGQTLVGPGGVTWGLRSSTAQGNQIVRAGIVDVTTVNVRLVLKWNGEIYQENMGNNWWVRGIGSPPWTYQPKGDPRPSAATESKDQTVVLAPAFSPDFSASFIYAGSITDSTGNAYTLVNGQVMVRLAGSNAAGGVLPHSTGVAQMAYCYAPTHAVWAQNAALKTWWRLSGPTGPWVGPQTASPLGAIVPIKASIAINTIGPQVVGH